MITQPKKEFYQNNKKTELAAALNAKELHKWIDEHANEIITKNEKLQDDLVRAAIYSGNVRNLDVVYSILEKTIDKDAPETRRLDRAFPNSNSVEEQFTASLKRIEKSDGFSPVIYAKLGLYREEMKDRILDLCAKMKSISPEEINNQSNEQISLQKMDLKNYGSGNQLLAILQTTPATTITESGNSLQGVMNSLKLDSIIRPTVRDIKTYIVKNELKEILESDNYSLVENAVRGAEKDKDIARQWAEALKIVGIDISQLKSKIAVPAILNAVNQAAIIR